MATEPTNMISSDPTTPLLHRRLETGRGGRQSSLAVLLGRVTGRRGGGGASLMVRETAARELDERRADWGYSKPVVALDMMWNLGFVIVSVVILSCAVDESPNVPIRLWICGYALQCVVHVVLVWLEYRRRTLQGGTDVQGNDGEDGEERNEVLGIGNQSRYYGGWAAPQIYFLGFAGVIKFGNIRIGGLSGIYKSHHYNMGHYEKLPYSERDIRSIYHVREYDVRKLLQIEEPLDIFLSHDWPVGITEGGDLKALLRQKPFFEQEIQEGTLGSKPAAELLGKLRPPYWFSAHLHCKFAALVQHEKDGHSTKFLALDKCLPGRKFLQVIEIESGPGPHELQLDEEWLAITRKYNTILPLTIRNANYNNVHLDIEQCRQFVRNKLRTRGSKPFEFVQTAPCYNPSQPVADSVFHGDGLYKNPQTEALLQFLELEYLLNKMPESREPAASPASLVSGCSFDYDSEDIPIDDIDDVDDTEDFKEVDPKDA